MQRPKAITQASIEFGAIFVLFCFDLLVFDEKSYFQACEWVMGKKEENLFLVSKSVAPTPNSGSFEYFSKCT